VFGTIYVYEQSKNELCLFRIWYVEKDKLIIIDRDDEKKEWVNSEKSWSKLTAANIRNIKEYLLKLLRNINQEKQI